MADKFLFQIATVERREIQSLIDTVCAVHGGKNAHYHFKFNN